MKKLVLGLIAFLSLSFAVAEKYRYGKIDRENNAIIILDMPEKLPDETLGGPFLFPLNTASERFVAESGFKEIENFYYMGQFSLIYADTTKGETDIKYIDSWGEFMNYVRGKK